MERLSGKHCQNRTAKTGGAGTELPQQGCVDWTARTRQPGQDQKDKTGRTVRIRQAKVDRSIGGR